MSNSLSISQNNLTIETSETLVNVLMVSESTVAGGAVTSVNGLDGVVVLDADDIAETATRVYLTPAQETNLDNQSGTNTGDKLEYLNTEFRIVDSVSGFKHIADTGNLTENRTLILSDFNQDLSHIFSVSNNVAIGQGTPQTQTIRRYVAIGDNALSSLLGANWEVAIGANAGQNRTSGNYGTYIGSKSGSNLTSGAGNTIIGAQVQAPTATTNNNVLIGNGLGVVCFHDDTLTAKVFNPFQFAEVTTVERTALPNTANTTVYDTDLSKVFTNDGTTWNAHW